MRSIYGKILVLGLVLAAVAAPLIACGPETPWESIKVPGTILTGRVRGDYFLGYNTANHLLVVDILRGKTFDLGPAGDRRFYDGDVLDGRILMLSKQHLLVVELHTGKTIHDIELKTPVHAFGFASKDRAFIHHGNSVSFLELQTGKTLQSIELGKETEPRIGVTPWQKVGNRLYTAGPATTLCIIDLHAGQLIDRLSVDVRGGIGNLVVDGSFVYFTGFQFSWAFRFDHVTCLNLDTNRCSQLNLGDRVRGVGNLAVGPDGSIYLSNGSKIDRHSLPNQRLGSFTTPGVERVLAIWRGHALIAQQDTLRMLEIKETAVAQK